MYEKLPINLRFMMNCELITIFKCIKSMEENPTIIWEINEQVYQPNIFEAVVFKKYRNLFDAYDPNKVE